MSKDKVSGAPFTLGSFGLAPVVHTRSCLLTFNPTGYSFVHWLLASVVAEHARARTRRGGDCAARRAG